MTESIGGVGQNIATAAYYCDISVIFCSTVGDDEAGNFARKTLEEKGMDTQGIITVKTGRTARYIAFNDTQRNLAIAMADMEIFHGDSTNSLWSWEHMLKQARPLWVAVDGNWNPRMLRKWIDLARENGSLVAFEPVSIEKSTRIFRMPGPKCNPFPGALGRDAGKSHFIVDLATPNEAELMAMTNNAPKCKTWRRAVGALDPAAIKRSVQEDGQDEHHRWAELVICALHLLPSIPCVLTKLGGNGVLGVEMLRLGDKRLEDHKEERYILLKRSATYVAGDGWRSILPRLDEEGWFHDFGGVYVRHFKPPVSIRCRDVVNVNGSGDSFLGVLLAGLVSGASHKMAGLIQVAQEGAAFTLQSHESVSPRIRALAPKVSSLCEA